MSIKILKSIVLTLILLLISSASRADEFPNLLLKIKPSIVGVGTFQETARPSVKLRGSGFIVGNGSYAFTNAHVLPDKIDEAHLEYLAIFSGYGQNPNVIQVKAVAVSKEYDIALLKIVPENQVLTPLKLAKDEEIMEGMSVAFTGFPIGGILGLYPATHQGIIAAFTPIVKQASQARELTAEHLNRLNDPFKVIQLDATAYPGNSGSALYSKETGRVVGIINSVFIKRTKEAVLSDPSGITFAIPAKYMRAMYKQHTGSDI